MLGAKHAIKAGASLHVERVSRNEESFLANIVGSSVKISGTKEASVATRIAAATIVGGDNIFGALETNACTNGIFSVAV